MRIEPKFQKATAVVRNMLLCGLTALLLCGCRDGMVDTGCYWGPIPHGKRLIALKREGVKTLVVVRLNPLPKLEAQARALGMNYVHIPTGLFVSPPEEGIRKFVEVARNPEMRPLYVTDQVARDRTQFYAGIYGMVAEDWTAERASWQMYRNGLRHWWPWFYKFKDIVKADEGFIRGKPSEETTQVPANEKSIATKTTELKESAAYVAK